MFTKLLLTLAVILVVVMVFRGQPGAHKEAARQEPTGNAPAKRSTEHGAARTSAWILIGVFVALTLAYGVFQWLDSRTLVTVRVIDAGTGQAVDYSAYRGAIGEHGFDAIDGRSVTLAETDRMEVIDGRPAIPQADHNHRQAVQNDRESHRAGHAAPAVEREPN